MEALRRTGWITLFLRLAVAAAFLSAVADRFGLWGGPGSPRVAWGDMAHFIPYVAKLNWYLPSALIPAVAWIATALEIVLGTGLILGLGTRWLAWGSGALLLTFALAMTGALGVKAPLDFSVFSASAGAFLLATCARYPLSLDEWLLSQRQGASPAASCPAGTL